MSGADLIALIVVLAGVGLAFWFSVRQQTHTFREEMHRLRQETQSALTTQIAHVVQSFNQQLGEVRAALQQGISEAGQLASQAQQTVGQRLAEATQLLTTVGQQLGGLQEAGRELRSAARTLESVLSGARTRGSFGEVALEQLLSDILPRDRFALQFRFATGAVVDAVVRMADKLLPIDSKFPLDSYRRLLEAASPEANEQSRREFARAVRKHVDDIAEKYIVPSEGTLEVAFMFVASESVYYELLVTEDGSGSVAAYCRSKRVVPVSPNTLYAHLAVVLMGLRGLQVEENARRLLGSLAGLQADLGAFAEVHAKLGTHLRNAQQSYADAAPKLEKMERSLAALARGELPQPVSELAERSD